jgi:hypothetical protein
MIYVSASKRKPAVNMMAKISFLKDAKVDSPRPIGENPHFAAAAAKLAEYQSELRGFREAIDRENARWYAAQQPGGDGDAIEIADRMLDGQNLAADQDTATKLAELEKKIRIIRPAIARQQEVVDRIRGELSVQAAKLVRDRHRKALANIMVAARALVAAANAERAIRGELLNLGFEAPESILPPPQLAAPLILGDESFHDSAISHFRRQLEGLGILP